MYDSSWEKASRSSHPNLWTPPIVTPPIVTPMSRGPMSEPNPAIPPEFPMQTTESERQNQRLPSVDEILFEIRHQETFRSPYQQEVHYIPTAFPQVFPQAFANQEPPARAQWHRASLRNNDYQFRPRGTFDPASDTQSIETQHMNHFPSGMQTGSSATLSLAPLQNSLPGITTKKRGRKKKSDTICSHCQLTQTPEWRRGPDGSRTLCNACGLFYLKLTKKFGFEDANMIFAYKKRHNDVQDRIVPTMQQKNRYMSETNVAEA